MKFRKKPVVIDATQWNKYGDVDGVLRCWMDDVGHVRETENSHPNTNIYGCRSSYCIQSLEGWHEVTPGDWIITGVKGERYPCKPDIFAATYEPA